jgi:aminoglycoside 6'-N-acetyltransferase I
MTIRPAQKADTVSWLRMREALWPSAPGEHARKIDSYFAGQLREPLEVLLASEEAGQMVGFIELSIRPYAEGCVTDRVAYIEGWYVDPSFRRQHVGAALVRAAEAWGRSQGCVELGSSTEITNETSAEAHRALGFVDTGTIRCFRKLL